MLRCADGSFYVGYTSDVQKRIKAHNDGRGALWTACQRPVALAYQEQHPTEVDAVARERQLKRWTHAKKLALIKCFNWIPPPRRRTKASAYFKALAFFFWVGRDRIDP
jgi:putative endonuclease